VIQHPQSSRPDFQQRILRAAGWQSCAAAFSVASIFEAKKRFGAM